MATTPVRPRPRTGRSLLGVTTAVVMAGTVLGAPPSSAEAAQPETIQSSSSVLTITTAGWGHGRGMSQYGANQAAKQGLPYDQILSFYYPGTQLDALPNGNQIRVWITADTDKAVHVNPSKGLRVKDAAGHTFTLPTGKNYTRWRMSRSGSTRVLYYRDAKGKYKKYKNAKFKLDAKRGWAFDNPKTGTVTLKLPDTSTRTYRGTLSLSFSGSGAVTVNTVPMESYLRSVVPSEMPASWASEALKAQSVAARTYAMRYKANLKGSKPYDICNTSSCQVYKGTATEYKASDQAIAATAGRVLTYQGQYAWTEFSSSNGGFAAKGDHAYLVAHEDPYDLAANQVYATTIKTSDLQKKYPKIGTFQSVSVSRDGNGKWGGRVTSVTLSGSKGSQTVSGTSFKSALGLRETMMTISGGLAPKSANYLRWQALGGSKGTALGVFAQTEQQPSGGLYAVFEKGVLWSSPSTPSVLLSHLINLAYSNAGGPNPAGLGFPTGDVTNTVKPGLDFTTGTSATFQRGMISCPSGTADAAACVVSLG